MCYSPLYRKGLEQKHMNKCCYLAVLNVEVFLIVHWYMRPFQILHSPLELKNRWWQGKLIGFFCLKCSHWKKRKETTMISIAVNCPVLLIAPSSKIPSMLPNLAVVVLFLNLLLLEVCEGFCFVLLRISVSLKILSRPSTCCISLCAAF